MQERRIRENVMLARSVATYKGGIQHGTRRFKKYVYRSKAPEESFNIYLETISPFCLYVEEKDFKE
jgi:hypothetical protein